MEALETYSCLYPPSPFQINSIHWLPHHGTRLNHEASM